MPEARLRHVDSGRIHRYHRRRVRTGKSRRSLRQSQRELPFFTADLRAHRPVFPVAPNITIRSIFISRHHQPAVPITERLRASRAANNDAFSRGTAMGDAAPITIGMFSAICLSFRSISLNEPLQVARSRTLRYTFSMLNAPAELLLHRLHVLLFLFEKERRDKEICTKSPRQI